MNTKTRRKAGGRKRLDQLDLAIFRTPDATPEQLILLQALTDAVQDYLFFGLASAEIPAQDFAAASRYLFDTGPRLVGAEGFMFDAHYRDSGLARFLPRDHFQAWLKRERERIVKENNL